MKFNHEEDQQLLKRIRAGEEPAFKALFEKYYRYLCMASFKICADEHKAKDFAQEVFLNIWRKKETINVHTSVNAFLKKAVVYKSIDYVRGQRLNFEEIVDDTPSQVGAQEKLEMADLKKLIHKTAARLPERCKIIFFMSRFEGLSHKEIAGKLEISTKTVEHQITKALKILRKTIQPHLSDDLLKFLFFLEYIGEIGFYFDLLVKPLIAV